MILVVRIDRIVCCTIHSAIMRCSPVVLNGELEMPESARTRLQPLLPVQYGSESLPASRFRSFGYRCCLPRFPTAPLQILKGHLL